MQFVVERYWPGASENDARVAMQTLRASCERLAATGVLVRYVGGTFVPGDELLSVRIEGTEAAVREAHRLAELTFDRVLTTMEVPSND
jgi:hypothetical protein